MENLKFTHIQSPKRDFFNERFAHLVLLSSGKTLRRVDQQPRFKLIAQLLSKYLARVKENSGEDVILEHLTINNTLAKRFFNKASPIFWMVQIAAKYYPNGDAVFGKSTVSTRSWTEPFTREAIEFSKIIWDECLPAAKIFTSDILKLAIEAAENQNVETPDDELDQLPTLADLKTSLQYLTNFVDPIGDRQPIDSVAICGEKPRGVSAKRPPPKTKKVPATKRSRHVGDVDDADVESLTYNRSATNPTYSDSDLDGGADIAPQEYAEHTSKTQNRYTSRINKTYDTPIIQTPPPVDNQIIVRLAALQETVDIIMHKMEFAKKSASPNNSNF